MRWYSIKENQPILSCCCTLVAIRNKQSNSIMLSLAEWDEGWKDWENKHDLEFDGIEVVYFCYPEPLPTVHI